MSTAAPSEVSEKVKQLNAGWRNCVAKALGMDPATFQLAQGTLGLQTEDSSGLFRMADAVPGNSVCHYYDPSSSSQFSSAYNMMLHALLPSDSSGLRGELGPMYAKWIAYRTADNSDLTQLQLFEKWANKNLDPGKAQSAISVYKLAQTDPLNLALDAYVDKANRTEFVDDSNDPFSLPTYSCTISNAKTAINTGSSASIEFHSSDMDTNSSATSVSGSVSGMYDIFSGSADGSYEEINHMAASSDFHIVGKIDKYATLVCDRGGWFTSNQYTRAYQGKDDNSIWDPNSNQGGWDAFFGSKGSMARRVSQLLLVSGYDITVTSEASYSASQFEQIKASASVGIWPFFSASASATHTTTATQDANGRMVMNYKSNKGLISIFGATVELAPN